LGRLLQQLFRESLNYYIFSFAETCSIFKKIDFGPGIGMFE